MILFHKPLVSIVLASYNHRNFVDEAIQSVLTQTFKDFELIVVDDGSTDGSIKIIEKVKDPRLRIFKLKINRKFHARNYGLRFSTGKYIAFQNSDDVWLKNKLERQVEELESNKQTVVCFTRLRIINEKGKEIKKSWAHRNLAKENRNNDAWLRLLFTTPTNYGIASAVVKHESLARLKGFCGSLVQMSDYDLWVRLAGLGQIKIIDDPLTEMRIIKGKNLSSPSQDVYLRSLIENVRILKRYLEWPINQYLKNIFPEVIPDGKVSNVIRTVSLMKYCWTLTTAQHHLFADEIMAALFENEKHKNEILEYYGPEIFKEFIYRRGKLRITLDK